MNRPTNKQTTSNSTLDLNALPPGRAAVSWRTEESPEELAHRLSTESRDHINSMALGWFLVLLVTALAGCAAYAGLHAETEGTRAAAWAVVAAVISAIPSFFAGRWSAKSAS